MHKFSIPMYSTHIHSLFHSLLHVHTYTHTLSTEVINHGLLAGGLDFGTSSNIRPWGKKKRRSTYCTHTHKGAYTHTLATILPSPSSILLPLLSEILVTDTTDLVQVVGVGGVSSRLHPTQPPITLGVNVFISSFPAKEVTALSHPLL